MDAKEKAEAKRRRRALARAGGELDRASKALVPILQKKKGRGPSEPAVEDSREEMVAELRAYGVSDYALRMLDQAFAAWDEKAKQAEEEL